jgi:hypothetical protein
MRKWESPICYEDRSAGFTTSRWRLAGVRTKEAGGNTDDGVLWLRMTRSGDTVTAALYSSPGLASGAKVAEGAADASGLDGTAESAVEVALAAANSSGLSGSFRLHDWRGEGTCPVQAALCTDEDLDALWDGIETLAGYDATAGCAEFIRLAGEDVLARVSAMYRDALGGAAAAEAWFLADASRQVPDLRRVANPAQLRLAAAHRALQIALGRSHRSGSDTMYSRLRDYHAAEYDRALASLVLAMRPAAGGAASTGSSGVVRQVRL